MSQKPNTTTLAIKAKISNTIRKDIYAVPTKFSLNTKPGSVVVITAEIPSEQKVKLFDKWFAEAKRMHQELNAYKKKRKKVASVHRQRAESGWYQKQDMKAIQHSLTQMNSKLKSVN